MEPYVLFLVGFGVVVLLTAWLPLIVRHVPFTLALFCVGLGVVTFHLLGPPDFTPHPRSYLAFTERITELAVIVALMGAGLKLDKSLFGANARGTWRLLAISMPLTIVSIALASSWLLGLGLASAILLGAALAPTDPVLAGDVQVGPPGDGKEDNIRFTLTSEAGLNDGLAFPFVNLAVALALAAQTGGSWVGQWVAIDVIWKLSSGLVAGLVIGWSLGWLTFRLPNWAQIARTGDGFVALGITCIAYGLTEAIHGYGFIAVFVAALAFRSVERGHAYHTRLHGFSDELERLIMMVVLVLFGGSIASGGLLAGTTWPVVLFAVLVLLVIRPLCGWIGLIGVAMPAREKLVISFFGIRGIGSIYYLAYGLGAAQFAEADTLWLALGLCVLLSIITHGLTATPVLARIDDLREQDVASSREASERG